MSANQDAQPLPHLTAAGQVHMVDVGAKPDTVRTATAEGWVHARPDVIARVRDSAAAKGDVLAVARVAGIQGAKRTADLIPLAHPLPVTGTTVDITLEADRIRVETTVTMRGPTGVEMEALTGTAAACLTLYDMLKAHDRAMVLGPIRLLSKTGGRTGAWRREVGDRHD
ncbi:MAG: cyclic pyranopterin monophosphate synthase MoaC [Thermaerobacter sp.]|nr:cyclic pyranopterin monophosphate synthase MoaC [Thermaerobacter sp.]